MQDQWSWLFSNFGVTNIWERGAVDSDAKIYQSTVKIDTAAELPVDQPLIVLAPKAGRHIQGTESLVDFVHPDNAIYMFGGSHENLSEEDFGGRDADALVYIPLVAHECYSHSAAYVALWDRYSKRGSHG